MSDPINKAIATGQVYVDYDPLAVLKQLAACIGYNAGYVIHLGDSTDSYLFRRLHDCIAFNDGRDTNIPLPAPHGEKL